MIEFFKIIGLSLLVTCFYGILHDQITARLSPEYFNSNAVPHHKVVLDAIAQKLSDAGYQSWANNVKNDPTTIAFIWGIVATWWVGIIGGLLLGLACRIGSWQKLTAKNLMIPLFLSILMTGVISLKAGIVGYQKHGNSLIGNPIDVKEEHLAGFYSNCASHRAAYSAGILSNILLLSWIIYRRKKLSSTSLK